MTEKQYSVLVYGTLRPGGGNYENFLQGHTVSEKDVRVRGLNMYGSARDGFPYVTEGDGVITATLMTVKPDHYEFVMQMLDFLEGYGGVGRANHYERKLVTVRDGNGEKVEAWIYILEGADARRVARNYDLTMLGDWMIQKRESSRAVQYA